MRRIASERGFTLIEAVVALAILGLTVVTALEVTSQLLHTQTLALHRREAAALADWKLNQLAASPADSARAYLEGRTGRVQLPPHSYSWRAILAPEPGGRMLWRASVTIEWDSQTYLLTTILHRRSWVMIGAPAASRP